MAEQAVYWVGQDGNVYYGDGQGGGVRNMGKLIGEPTAVPYRPGQGFDAELGSGTGQRIDDPALKKGSTAPTADTGGATYKPLNQAQVDTTNASLSSLGQILSEALSNASKGYNRVKEQLGAQEAERRGIYDAESLKNQQNYDSNLGASLRAGRSGLSGLMAALRGGGGGGNDYARNWIQNTVADTTANDIREGYNTFDENRAAQDQGMSTFLNELRGKREENQETFENKQRAARLYDAQQKQNLYQKLADLYGESGNASENARYLGLAGGQAGNIAQNMVEKVGDYNTTPIKVQSPDITAFAAPEQQSMSASENARGTGIFSMLDPRRREKELAGA